MNIVNIIGCVFLAAGAMFCFGLAEIHEVFPDLVVSNQQGNEVLRYSIGAALGLIGAVILWRQ